MQVISVIWLQFLLVIAALAVTVAAEDRAPTDEPQRVLLSGKVVRLADALKQRGIKSYVEEIKDQVTNAWKAEERAKRAETIAKEMVEEIRSGRLLADVAKKYGAQLATTQPFTRTRDGLNTPLPAALVSALFKSPAGTPEMAPANEAHVIGVVSEVTAANPKADADALKRLEEELGSTLANDLSLSLATALRERLSVSIDRAALDSAF